MNKILCLFVFLLLYSCTAEEIFISNIKTTENPFLSFRDHGFNKDYRVIELNIPLEFILENKTNTTVVIQNLCEFSLMLNEKNIRSGYNLANLYEIKGEDLNSEFILNPNQIRRLKVNYLFGISNSDGSNDCVFDDFVEELKITDTIFIEKNSCLNKFYNYIHNGNNTIAFYYNKSDKRIKKDVLIKKLDK